MLEALIQSRWLPGVVEVELLPALPEQWSAGSVEGVRVRGGATVDMRWAAGKITTAEFHANHDALIRLILPKGQLVSEIHTAGRVEVISATEASIRLKSGTSFVIAFR